jgi:outer membrane protein assembly factor BamB
MRLKIAFINAVILCVFLQSNVLPSWRILDFKSARAASAPDFTLQDTEGKIHKLSDYKSKPVILDFTASWCGPCHQAAPELDKVAKKYAGKIEVLSIDIQEDIDTVKLFKEQTGAFWPYLLDKDGSVGASYNVTGIPHVVLVDANREIYSETTGYDEKLFDKLSAEIDRLFGQSINPKVRLKWKWEPYIGFITTCLVLDKGLIYAGSATGKMYCIKESDRSKVWEFLTNYEIYSSPLVSNNRLYFGSADKKLYCLDATTGNKLWDYKTEGPIWGSAIISNDMVYIGSYDGFLYCLDAITGSKVWSCPTGGRIWNSPAISNGRVYVVSSTVNKVFCIDSKTGIIIWQREFKAQNDSSYGPYILNDKIYISLNEGKIYCLDANDGKIVWEFSSESGIYPSFLITSGKVYFGADKLYCLDAITGKKLWDYVTNSGVYINLITFNDKIYCGSNNGTFYCLNANNGEMIWFYKTGGAIGSISITNGNLYSGSDNMYCLDANKGTIIWVSKTGDSGYKSPAILDNMLYLGSSNRKFYCVERNTGNKIWEYVTENAVTTAPTVTIDNVYFGSYSGKLYCLNKNTGAKIWEFATNGSIYSTPKISNNKVYLYCSPLTPGLG